MPTATTIDSPRTPTNALTPTEAERAIYIDFEGLTDHAPSLVGILVEGAFSAVVFDPVLQAGAQEKSLTVRNGRTALLELLERARTEDRRIAGFGKHERMAAQEHFGVDISPVYVDVSKVAKRWWRQAHPGDRPARPKRRKGWRPLGRWSLSFFERRLGLERAPHLRGHNAAARLRSVRTSLARHGSYECLGRATKGKWTKLLDYNEVDVRNLGALATAAARGGNPVLNPALSSPDHSTWPM